MVKDYIRAGFLCDLLEPWVDIEGSEWGAQMQAMHDLVSKCLGMEDERAVIVTDWMMEDLNIAFEADWWGDTDMYLSEIIEARDIYPRVVEMWRKRAQSFNIPDGADASGAFEETLASLPYWMKPMDQEARKRATRLELINKRLKLERELAEIDRQIETMME